MPASRSGSKTASMRSDVLLGLRAEPFTAMTFMVAAFRRPQQAER